MADRNLLELALKVGLAVGREYESLAVGSDTRTSGDAVKHAFITGLLAAGAAVYDVGVLPTPSLALAARDFRAGAMITASHNPPEYNGIKLLNPDGSAFSPAQQLRIEEMVEEDSLDASGGEGMSQASARNGIIEKHIGHIMEKIPHTESLKVVVDCGCGAASVITPELLERLGCDVFALNSFPSGFFPRASEPTEANLANLIRATKELGADLGIAHDGDADRMMAVDDRGRFIPGDKLLALFSRQEAAGKVVTTIDASMVIDEMDFSVTRTPVGDTFVSEELKKGGDFGGEPSGSWVFPGNSLCPDGIYAAARLVSIAGRRKVSELVDEIPEYPILRGSIDGVVTVVPDLEKRLMKLEPLSVSKMDGLKLNFADGWLLVRASGTEPKIRLTAEARTDIEVKDLYRSATRIIREFISEARG